MLKIRISKYVCCWFDMEDETYQISFIGSSEQESISLCLLHGREPNTIPIRATPLQQPKVNS